MSDELKRRLDAQERAISLIAAHLTHDPSWAVYRDERLGKWMKTAQENTGIKEEDRKDTLDSLAETLRILKPPVKTFWG